jgi:hypothetical protein
MTASGKVQKFRLREMAMEQISSQAFSHQYGV